MFIADVHLWYKLLLTPQQLCIHRLHCRLYVLQQHHLLGRLHSSSDQLRNANLTLSVFCTLPASPLLHLELQLYCHELPLCACLQQAYFVNVHGCLRGLCERVNDFVTCPPFPKLNLCFPVHSTPPAQKGVRWVCKALFSLPQPLVHVLFALA